VNQADKDVGAFLPIDSDNAEICFYTVTLFIPNQGVPMSQSTCEHIYNCCDCGGNQCGCRYCWSCNACDTCLNHDNDWETPACENVIDSQ